MLYNRERQTVILTRQFRIPTYLNGNETGLLIEACAGLLDKGSAEDSIRREAEEETGYRVGRPENRRSLYVAWIGNGDSAFFCCGIYARDEGWRRRRSRGRAGKHRSAGVSLSAGLGHDQRRGD
ncbi:NUDIX domain-containing protein [Paenibacillus sp. P26]|nr:NUDIX domain-containing protein [Paenibacillus sp. P26]